jgi:hypothetical protein
MKKVSRLIIFIFLIAGLSACGNDGEIIQPILSESDSIAVEPSPLEDDHNITVEPSPSPAENDSNVIEPSPAEDDGDEPDETETPVIYDNVIDQIKNGDFSNVRFVDEELDPDTLGWLNQTYEWEIESPRREWVECDLNENGLKGLIWQEKESWVDHEGFKIIHAIFAIIDDEAVYTNKGINVASMRPYHFLSKNGNFMSYHYSSGQTTNISFTHHTFDEKGEMAFSYRLMFVYVEDWYIDELKEDGIYDEFVKDRPYLAKAGTYYFEYTEIPTLENNIEISEKKFLAAFKEMTGFAFYSDDNPLLPEWL